MSEYDPIPDAVAFLARRTPIERHAIARLLDTDGPALPVLKWIVEQPDCDVTTAAMIFWRLRSLPIRQFRAHQTDIAARNAVLGSIAANANARRYTAAKIAWDGLEVWDRLPLISAALTEGLSVPDLVIPPLFMGPFGAAGPEPAGYAFFESPYDEDDIFDSLWRTPPKYAAAADWLAGKPAEIWMATVDEVAGSHPDEIYEWMILQPQCPSSVAGQIFWSQEPLFAAKQQLEARTPLAHQRIIDQVLARWWKNDFAPCDLDFSRYSDAAGYRALLQRYPGKADPLDIPPGLLDPSKGRVPTPVRLCDDFGFWVIRVDLASLVPRGRDAAIAAWEADKKRETDRRKQERERADADASPATFLERLFYGGKFTGAKAEIDRAWKQFNLVTAGGAAALIALWRAGAPPLVSFSAFLTLVLVVSLYQSSANMGGWRRITAWWAVAFVISMILAFVFRWIDN